MTSSSYFFRVEHDLLRSEAFKTLAGSAIKVYLVIGLYSDFGTDWAYPSIRTIAQQAGLSRQTVLAAIKQLAEMGILATSKSKGRSTADRIIRQAPGAPCNQAKIHQYGQDNRSNFLRSRPPKWSRIFRSHGESGPILGPVGAPTPRPRRPAA